jgi:hypothetical protein
MREKPHLSVTEHLSLRKTRNGTKSDDARGLLSAGALTLAGATLGAMAPRSTLADPSDAAAINVATFIDMVTLGLNGGDTTVIDTNVSPSMIEHQIYGVPWPGCTPPPTVQCTGPAAIKELVRVLHQAFSHLFADVQHVGTGDNGNLVFGQAFTSGFFTGTYVTVDGRTVQGHGRPFQIAVHDTFRFEQLTPWQLARGQRPKVVEHCGAADILTLLIELGVLDPTTLPHL